MNKQTGWKRETAARSRSRQPDRRTLMLLQRRLKRNLKKIISAGAVGLLLVFGLNFLMAAPTYRAECRLYAAAAMEHQSQTLARDCIEAFSTWEVHEQVRLNLGLDFSHAEMESMLSVTAAEGSSVLHVAVDSRDPQLAAAMANEYAAVAGNLIADVMQVDAPAVLSRAVQPEEPVDSGRKISLLAGFVLGALIMTAVVVVRFFALETPSRPVRRG